MPQGQARLEEEEAGGKKEGREERKERGMETDGDGGCLKRILYNYLLYVRS